MSLLLSTKGGGLLMLDEIHHKINLIVSEDLLLNEGVVPLLWITLYMVLLSG
jgi:hypothetical protein